jgi:CheY-like chemotaxis protein
MKSTLLIVDDKPENLLVLEAVLGSNYELIRAHSGQEALEVLAQTLVHLVLLDIEMPGMDGYETTRLIRQMPQHGDVPIILISGVFTDDPYVKKGYKAGAVDYFTKPFDPEILRQKVALYASLRQKDELIRRKDARIRELEERFKERV